MRLTGAKGFAIGVGVLAGMQLFLSSQSGTNAFGIVTRLPTAWLDSWFDPTKPLIADHSGSASSGGSGGSSVQDCSKVSGSLQQSACVAGQPPGQRQCNLLSGPAQWMCSAGIGPASAAQQAPLPNPSQIPTSGAAGALYT